MKTINLPNKTEAEKLDYIVDTFVTSKSDKDIISRIHTGRCELQALILAGAISPDSQLAYRERCFYHTHADNYHLVVRYFTNVASYYRWAMGALFTLKGKRCKLTARSVKMHEARSGLTKILTTKFIETLSVHINMLAVNEFQVLPLSDLFDDTEQLWCSYPTFTDMLGVTHFYLTPCECAAATYLYRIKQNWGVRKTETQWLYRQLAQRWETVVTAWDKDYYFERGTQDLATFWALGGDELSALLMECTSRRDREPPVSIPLEPLVMLITNMAKFNLRCSITWDSHDTGYIKYIESKRSILTELRFQATTLGLSVSLTEMSVIEESTERAIDIVDKELFTSLCDAIRSDLNLKLKAFGAPCLVFITDSRPINF